MATPEQIREADSWLVVSAFHQADQPERRAIINAISTGIGAEIMVNRYVWIFADLRPAEWLILTDNWGPAKRSIVRAKLRVDSRFYLLERAQSAGAL